MKIKFLRSLVLAIVCGIVFVVTTLNPSLRDYKLGDFLQGFTGGMGTVAAIAAIFYYFGWRKEKTLSNEQ
ncbi:MAG: hypothetical protein ACXVB0_22640 [Mucilaginibacter sp.]